MSSAGGTASAAEKRAASRVAALEDELATLKERLVAAEAAAAASAAELELARRPASTEEARQAGHDTELLRLKQEKLALLQQQVGQQMARDEAVRASAEAKKMVKQAEADAAARKLSAAEADVQAKLARVNSLTSTVAAVALLRATTTILATVPLRSRKLKAETMLAGSALGVRHDRIMQALSQEEFGDADLLPVLQRVPDFWFAFLAACEVQSSATDLQAVRPVAGAVLEGAWLPAMFDVLAVVVHGKDGAVATYIEREWAAELCWSLPARESDAIAAPLVEALTTVRAEGGQTLVTVVSQAQFGKVKFIASRRPATSAAPSTKTSNAASVSHAYGLAVLSDEAALVRLTVVAGGELVGAVVDTGSSHDFVNHEWFFGLEGERQSAAMVAPHLRSLTTADGVRRELERAIEPWWFQVATGEHACGLIVYPIADLPVDLLIGLAGMRALGGVTINVPTHGAPTVEVGALHVEACGAPAVGLMTEPEVPAVAPVTEPTAEGEVQSALLLFDGALAVEMEGALYDSDVSRWMLSPLQLAGVELMARSIAAGEPTDVAAHVLLFRPDLEQPDWDPALDVVPDRVAADKVYRLASGVDRFDELVGAVDGMPAEVAAWLKAEVRGIDGLTLLSSEAPPKRFGPVRGAGSVHRIRLLPAADVESIFDKARPRSQVKEQYLQDTKQSWLELGVIERVEYGKTRVVNVPVVVAKKNAAGEVVGHRVAVDFRRLNAMCETDRYAPPLQSDVLDMLSAAWRVSLFDMKALFHQFELFEADRWLTTTVFAPGEYFQFVGSPFGLSSIMATAQRFMDEKFKSATCMPYVDDCGIAHVVAGDWQAAAVQIVDFLRTCAGANMAVNIDKTQLLTAHPVVLGHDVDCVEHTFTPQASRLRALHEYVKPMTNAALRRFLSMAAAWARFVPGWAMVATRLRVIIHKSAPLRWTADAEAAFVEAKRMLIEACSASAHDPNKATYLFTDAAKCGLGWVVAQPVALGGGPDAPLRIVSCGGRATQPFEKRLEIGELELLAFREALLRDAPIVVGLRVPAVWCVDNKSVMHIKDQAQPVRSEAVRRWLVELQFGEAAGIEVRWVPSATNPADAISRMYEEEDEAMQMPMRGVRARLAAEPRVRRALLWADDDDLEEFDDDETAHAMVAAEAVVRMWVAGELHGDGEGDAVQPGTPLLESVVDGEARDVKEVIDHDADEPAPEPMGRLDGPPGGAPVLAPIRPAVTADAAGVTSARGSMSAAAQSRAAAAELASEEPYVVDELEMARVLEDVAHRAAADDERRRFGIETIRDDSKLAYLLRQAVQQKSVPPFVAQLKAARDGWGRIFVERGGRRVMYVPPSLVREVVATMHADEAGAGAHRQASGTLAATERRFFSPLFRTAVTEHIAHCGVCVRLAQPTTSANINFDATPDRKFGRVYADVFTIEGQIFLLMSEWVTGTIEIEELERATGSEVERAVGLWIARYGVMDRLVVDVAQANIGVVMEAAGDRDGYVVDPIAARNQQANAAERQIQTTKHAIRAMVALQVGGARVRIDRALVMRARSTYMAAVSSGRGFSPFQLLHGVSMRLPIDQVLGLPVEPVATVPAGLSAEQQQQWRVAYEAGQDAQRGEAAKQGMAARHVIDARHRAKKDVARKVAPFVPVVGEVVWVLNNQASHPTKFQNLIKKGQLSVVVSVDVLRRRVRLRDFATAAPRRGWYAMRRLEPVHKAPLVVVAAAPEVGAEVSELPSVGASSAQAAAMFPMEMQSDYGVVRDVVMDESQGLLLVLDTTAGGGRVEVVLAATLPPAVVAAAQRAKRALGRVG